MVFEDPDDSEPLKNGPSKLEKKNTLEKNTFETICNGSIWSMGDAAQSLNKNMQKEPTSTTPRKTFSNPIP